MPSPEHIENAKRALGVGVHALAGKASNGATNADPRENVPLAQGLEEFELSADAERGADDDTEAINTPPPKSKTPAIHATPYAWKDPTKITLRDWLYGFILIRKFVTATVSPGAVGKSSLLTAEVLAMVSRKALLGILPKKQLRVWLWNLEDPQEETERKIQAAALHYRLSPDDIGDRLFVDSGRDQPLVIATTTRTGALIARPVVDALMAEIIARKIDVLIIDPFVSCHELPENDNTAMDMIVKEWGKVADRGNCAVHLVDHTRKMGGAETEVTVDSSRGGKAKTDACRGVRVVNRMTKEEGEKAGVENHRLYFRTFDDKPNLQPPAADASDWFKLKSVDLGNGLFGGPGDSVGVVTTWEWPDPLAGMTGADFDKVAAVIRAGKWRESPQASKWVGRAVAEALDLNADNKADKTKILGMLKVWRAAGSLIPVDGEDEKRMPRKFIEVKEED
jgi:AAA domain